MFTFAPPVKPRETRRNAKSSTTASMPLSITDPDRMDVSGGISLADFVRESWHVLEPSIALDWSWHLDAICYHAQELLMDWMRHQRDPAYVQRVQNLLINVPPGSGKSRLISVCMPAWMWTKWPSWRAIFISANPRVALRDSVFCRDLIESDWYQKRFQPPWSLRIDQSAKSNYWNTAGGMRLAFGVGSKVTGDRADFLGLDDLNDATEVESQTLRDYVNDRWDNAIYNRVNDLTTSTRLGIQQRLAEDDWSGHVLRSNEWEHLCIPQEWEEEHRKTTAFDWTDPRSIKGDLMMPKRFPIGILTKEKARLGSYGYAGQHQQRPVPREGGMIKGGWFGRYMIAPEYPELIVQSWDTAYKGAKLNDPWVCQTWAVYDGEFYLLETVRKRMEYPEGKRCAGELALKWEPHLILIEDKGSGQSLIQDLREGIDPGNNLLRYFSIIPVIPIADKITRMSVESAAIEAGRVYLPQDAPWLADFESEVLTFPAVKHDDQVDCLSQFLKWGRSHSHGSSVSGSEGRAVDGVMGFL
jgi:predicted phage terminase large subunit-like protein